MRGYLNQRNLAATTILVAAFFGAQSAHAATVTAFGGSSSWAESDMRGAGTAEIVDLTGEGGNLENNAPLPSGAVKLTTGGSVNDKAEVGTGGPFGTIGDFLTIGSSLTYSYFNPTGNTNTAGAASIKLTVIDPNPVSGADDYTTFVYEPYWNQSTPGAAIDPPVGDWQSVFIDGSTGIFWHTGIYAAINQFGDGSEGKTLAGWNSFFGNDLLDAVIVGLSVGIGTYNQGVTTYFDDVSFSTQNGDVTYSYDFEAAAVPVPAALPLMLSGFGALGFIGWRRRRLATN